MGVGEHKDEGEGKGESEDGKPGEEVMGRKYNGLPKTMERVQKAAAAICVACP